MEALSLILRYIDVYLFAGYSLFTLCLVIISLFARHNPLVIGLTNAANRIIIFSGLLFLALWAIALSISLTATLPEAERASMMSRITGPYWWSYWLPLVFFVTLTQLLWFKWIAKYNFTRLLIGFLLFFNFEKFVIIVTSLHRDYLPSSWNMESETYAYILLGLIIRLFFYAGLCVVYYFVKLEVDKKIKS
jgi:molybdopterin-containing oxidoreductase family membrane subunit